MSDRTVHRWRFCTVSGWGSARQGRTFYNEKARRAEDIRIATQEPSKTQLSKLLQIIAVASCIERKWAFLAAIYAGINVRRLSARTVICVARNSRRLQAWSDDRELDAIRCREPNMVRVNALTGSYLFRSSSEIVLTGKRQSTGYLVHALLLAANPSSRAP